MPGPLPATVTATCSASAATGDLDFWVAARVFDAVLDEFRQCEFQRVQGLDREGHGHLDVDGCVGKLDRNGRHGYFL